MYTFLQVHLLQRQNYCYRAACSIPTHLPTLDNIIKSNMMKFTDFKYVFLVFEYEVLHVQIETFESFYLFICR